MIVHLSMNVSFKHYVTESKTPITEAAKNVKLQSPDQIMFPSQEA